MKYIRPFGGFLNEVGDATPLEWSWNPRLSDERMTYYNFFLGEDEYEVRIIRVDRESIDVQFSVGGSTETITGAGMPFTVLATVTSIIKDYINSTPEVNAFFFTPSMNYEGDRRRLKIYLAYVRKVFPRSSVKLQEIGGDYFEVKVKLNRDL